jgi:hypothetical protein
MEIYHVKTSRKNFLHYSFEFLMLFLAISLRENGKTVKEKAQQLIDLIQRQYGIKSSRL